MLSLSYTSVEHVAEVATAKIDIEATYHLVPVHPLDHPLQAMEWGRGVGYIDPLLPFGSVGGP